MERKKKGFLKKARNVMLLVAACLLMLGGLPKGFTENVQAAEVKLDNRTAIQTVIEKEFNGPDKKYRELWNAAMKELSKELTEEQYQEYLKSPTNLNLLAYTEKTYAPYFTEKGYDVFTYTGDAFMASMYPGDFNLKVSNIKIKQNMKRTKSYNFTFEVTYTNPHKQSSVFNYRGKASLLQPGKISVIEFTDLNGLEDELNKLNKK
ncbi:hypothetical protein [Planococcus ruber]|uniref:hypothetical protein n=1 Tax=Planococcus ruber TaxID=2027871 RepID=UPI001FEFF890|nr:hypothetical protein [Planococcus ruber]MCJ1907671.1 hypothetical protein [Planococcus ruber]